MAPFIVQPDIADAARVLIRNAVRNAARVYSEMGYGEAKPDATRAIAGFLLVKRKTRILASELSRDVRVCRGASLQKIQEMVSPLLAGGWLAPEKPHGGNNSWLVNPDVHERFKVRAAKEAAKRTSAREQIGKREEAEYDMDD